MMEMPSVFSLSKRWPEFKQHYCAFGEAAGGFRIVNRPFICAEDIACCPACIAEEDLCAGGKIDQGHPGKDIIIAIANSAIDVIGPHADNSNIAGARRIYWARAWVRHS